MLRYTRYVKVIWSDPIVIEVERRFYGGWQTKKSYTISRSSYGFRNLGRELAKCDYESDTPPHHKKGDGIKWISGKYKIDVPATTTYMFRSRNPDDVYAREQFLMGRNDDKKVV